MAGLRPKIKIELWLSFDITDVWLAPPPQDELGQRIHPLPLYDPEKITLSFLVDHFNLTLVGMELSMVSPEFTPGIHPEFTRNSNKVWLIYAYHRATGEIVAWVWGKRNLATARDLRKKITELGITFDTIYTDDWTSFVKIFKSDNHVTGKANTVGIEGNNCRLRHRIRRAFRKTCCFSKNLYNHLKSFELVFFYINFGHV